MCDLTEVFWVSLSPVLDHSFHSARHMKEREMNGQHFNSVRLFALTLVTGFSLSAQALDLSGRCYLGHKPDESHELQGVTVILYGAPEAGATRTQLDTETSDSRGWYGLTKCTGSVSWPCTGRNWMKLSTRGVGPTARICSAAAR